MIAMRHPSARTVAFRRAARGAVLSPHVRVAAVAVTGGALVAVGALLPWLSLYAGLVRDPGTTGLNGRLLLAGGALGSAAGVVYLWRPRPAFRWGIGLLGAALLAFAAWLLVQLFVAYRELGGDPFLVGRLGPGLFVTTVGAAALLGTLVVAPVEDPASTGAGARGSIADAVRFGVALCSASAAVVHFGVLGEHVHEYWLAGVFFAVVGTSQLGFAGLVSLHPGRGLYLVGAVGSAAIIAVWVVSRTRGVPLGPLAGAAEPVGFPDVLCTALEALVVVGSIALLRPSTAQRAFPRGAVSASYWISSLVVVPLTVAALLSAVGATTPVPHP